MIWIGQQIYDQVSRFRNGVYLEDLTTTTETSVLVVDSNGLVSKSTSVAGDLTSIVAGTGLSGTSLTGPIPTLNVDAAQAGITSLGTLTSLAVTSASDLGSAAMTLTNTDVDQIALDINANNSSASIIDISASSLTSGNAIFILANAHTASAGTIKVHSNWSATSTGTGSYEGLYDAFFNKTGAMAVGANSVGVGYNCLMRDTATNNGNSATQMAAFKGKVDSASAVGFGFNTGLDLEVTDGTKNTGIYLKVENGGDDIKMVSNADTGDYCTIATTTHGATTITTVDSDESGDDAVAHFEIAADGDITLDASGQIKLEPLAGNNILLDGTIAIDAGVVTGATSITSTAFVGTLSTASQPNVTGVGTIGTGVWQGTTIKTAYIGNDQVTEDKLANTLLAEIDANTAKVTNSDQSKSDIDSLEITTVGTIDGGAWRGDAIASTYLDADTAHLGVTQTFTGAKTFDVDIVGKTTKERWIKNIAYVVNAGTTEYFIPMVGASENTNNANATSVMLMPTAGKLLKAHVRSSIGLGGSSNEVTVKMVNWDADEAHGTSTDSIMSAVTINGWAGGTFGVFDFTGTLDSGVGAESAAFTAHEMLAVGIKHSAAMGNAKYFVTLVFEMDWAGY